MRVRFGPHDPRSRALLLEFDARVQRMFLDATRAARDLSWWRHALAEVHPGLDVERFDEGSWVVRTEARKLLPLAERLVAQAPPSLTFEAERPARAVEHVLASIRQSSGVELGGAQLRAGFARGHLIEIVVYLAGGRGDEREQVAAEQLVWGVLGEDCANAWIGGIDLAPLPRAGPLRVLGNRAAPERAFLVSELAASIAAASQGVQAELPEAPHFALAEDPHWTLFELEPDVREDWAAQDDLVMTTTCVPELLKCYLEGAPFSSLRFSRHGELFCHLKYEAEGEFGERLAMRTRLEDSLDRELRTKGLGAVVGAGLGIRYAYIDLSLNAVEESFESLRRVAREHELPQRSWLQPFDTDLQAEWLELYAGAPPPPGVEE